MFGQARIALADHAVAAVARAARIGRIAVRLFTRTRLTPADAYAALATARFMAAHDLIERAEAACDLDNDDDLDLVQVRQPLWFGGTTIVEDET
ncbi:hypothetical protein [Streptomyces venezuelae]|uniref:hypothetical protein n=1 Tax=Streptomyces venezuelae TaxID=54571 RepID=UPI00342F83EB